MDLYFNGHIHNYFRATVNGRGEKADPGDATTFVTTSPMGMKFDDYDGELDGVLGFQTGGHSDERQYFTYVEVREDGITVTAYQRTQAGDASITKCGDYTVIDSFAIRKASQEPEPAEPTAAPSDEPAAEPAKSGVSPVVWVLIGVGAAAAAAFAAVFVIRRKKRGADA